MKPFEQIQQQLMNDIDAMADMAILSFRAKYHAEEIIDAFKNTGWAIFQTNYPNNLKQ